MFRGLVVLLLVAGLVGGAVLAPRWLGSQSDSGAAGPVGETCRPLAEACQWQIPAGTVTLSMSPGEGDELLLELILPAGMDIGDPVMVLTGESMYMGEYPLALSAGDEPGHYRVRFVPPFCSTGDDMVWRVNPGREDGPLAPPFRILFSPSEAS